MTNEQIILLPLISAYAQGVISLQKAHDPIQLGDMWHAYNQDIDINIFTDEDADTIHATAYFLDADGNQTDQYETLF